MSDGFQRTLDRIRATSDTEREKGALFERLMKQYFQEDPHYRNRFGEVWMWSDWATARGLDHTDTGIDLVAEEREGGYCAIQCKCYAPGTRISKAQIDSFIAESDRDPYTSRMIVDTGDDWGPNAIKTIRDLRTPSQVLRFDDLASAQFDWPDLITKTPEDLRYAGEPWETRPHQQKAINDVLEGFEETDRGKLVMACGSGKTFVALRLAEEMSGRGGRVLYLVPSIALLAQSMREWAEQKKIEHRYLGVCSDPTAGKDNRNNEDASLVELEIPPNTDADDIRARLERPTADAMTVVFCTYQSLPIIEQVQAADDFEFDLVICDEAHRTTGVDDPMDEKTSPFVLVHDEGRIAARKRLYMTATPRLYTDAAKSRAAQFDKGVFSMDDEDTYGPEFHRLKFAEAVDQGLLTDYKVVVLAISEEEVDGALQAHLATNQSEINLTDTAKIVGCWRALQDPENILKNNRLPTDSKAAPPPPI